MRRTVHTVLIISWEICTSNQPPTPGGTEGGGGVGEGEGRKWVRGVYSRRRRGGAGQSGEGWGASGIYLTWGQHDYLRTSAGTDAGGEAE